MLGSKEYPFHSSQLHDKKAGGGIEVHVEHLSKYISAMGHDVFIITREFPGQKRFEVHKKIRIHRVSFINSTLLRNPSFNLMAFTKAWSILQKEKIHVIHSHGPVAGFFGSLLSLISNIPMVFTPHGSPHYWGSLISYLLSTLMKFSIDNAKLNILISANEKNLINNNPHILLSNGINIDDYHIKREPRNKVRFLFLGRIEEVKGVKLLIEAYRTITEQISVTELWIAGKGILENELREYSDRHNLNVNFLGWVKDVPDVMSQCDVFILPSTETGLPMALLEAMASGIIVITSLNYIQNMNTGILIDTLSTKSLVSSMLMVAKDLQKYQTLGANARTYVSNHASWRAIASTYISAYQGVIE